jgi:hypothetical protein
MLKTTRHGKRVLDIMIHFSLPSLSQNVFDFSNEIVIGLIPCVSIVARQQLGKHIPTATNIHEAMELFDM